MESGSHQMLTSCRCKGQGQGSSVKVTTTGGCLLPPACVCSGFGRPVKSQDACALHCSTRAGLFFTQLQCTAARCPTGHWPTLFASMVSTMPRITALLMPLVKRSRMPARHQQQRRHAQTTHGLLQQLHIWASRCRSGCGNPRLGVAQVCCCAEMACALCCQVNASGNCNCQVRLPQSGSAVLAFLRQLASPGPQQAFVAFDRHPPLTLVCQRLHLENQLLQLLHLQVHGTVGQEGVCPTLAWPHT